MDEQQRVFFGLVTELLHCPDPYRVAGRVLAGLLAEGEELYQELGRFVEDLVELAGLENGSLLQPEIENLQADLRAMSGLRREVDVLFSEETQERCGRGAVPLLAAALCSAWEWVEFASEWLDAAERLRLRADAVLARLPKNRRVARLGGL